MLFLVSSHLFFQISPPIPVTPVRSPHDTKCLVPPPLQRLYQKRPRLDPRVLLDDTLWGPFERVPPQYRLTPTFLTLCVTQWLAGKYARCLIPPLDQPESTRRFLFLLSEVALTIYCPSSIMLLKRILPETRNS